MKKQSTGRSTRASSIYKEANVSSKNSSPLKNQSSNIGTKRNMLKSVECSKTKYKSPTKRKEICKTVQQEQFDLSQAMRVSRQKDIAQITKNVALLKYYNCLIMLFMTVYTSSQLIITNIFQKQHKSYPSFGIALIDGLLKVYTTYKQSEKEMKLKRLATNVMKIASLPSQFEKKVQFISRKTVLNFEKRKQIQLSFMEVEVESFWERFSKTILISSQIEYMEDIFQFASQKLCLKDFQHLVDNYLATPRFSHQLTEHSLIQNHNLEQTFTVQFLLIERICLIQHPETAYKTKKKPNDTKKCDIY